MTLIKDLSTNDEFVGFYLLKELELKQTNTSPAKDYFDLVLCDASGQLPAKYWDVKETEKDDFTPMTLVKVQGIVQLYREKPQVKITRIRNVSNEDGVSLTDFIRAAPIESAELLEVIYRVIESISDPVIRDIISFCVDKVSEKLAHYPAAKMHHHAYFAGLAYHIVRMLEIGEFLCKQRPFLNADMIKAGIILHDIAKPEEMIAQLGVVTDYSTQGKLIGHIAMAAGWITEAALRLELPLDSEQVIGLQHLILSHHNLGEWGSPVQPQTAEAVALHYIDALDAKLQMAEDALSATSDKELWTQPVRGLENKALYRMSL
ncbi:MULTISPECIES: 3'-5' exoribonuclease YhaM family protein [unclassified Paenibacillus]|uniref:3'-5' exoribonuclease YhaM family protein n=1 Tax=unclassified Paenibacillus TaxID=185978 RepID=UPI001C10B692|nr:MULTISPECIES: HD domain-containing protein [unclassified Paenibacillus]MBU5445405.1 HD domain-containing protein [Paenibacillus sp. MSJ-34]CAH0118996.1 3'-5' exoribonuclease YhaM [Paenibacillus sp. CECT 9249]